VPVAADRVGWVEDPNTRRVWYTLDGELVEPYDPDPGDPGEGSAAPLPDYTGQLLHISAGNRSGELFGLGVLAQYGLWLGGAAAAEDYAGSYFAGGTLPPAVLQSPTTLTQPQADELKAKWRAMQSSREPVVLPTGYVLTPVVSNAVDAQLVESRTWNASEVAMLLGIPSYKLGLPGASMTYQNIESADIEFVRDSVDRYAGPLAAAFSQWLMPSGTSVQWDYAHRMRADQKSTMEVVNGYVGSKVLTVDEARAMLGRPPLDVPEEASSTPPGVPEPPTEDVAATTPEAAPDTTSSTEEVPA
jgi:HK97 family phage portal protein